MKDGEIVKISKSGFWWDRCCSCKLIHLNQVFRIKNNTFYRCYRDQWATEQVRKKHRNKVKRGK